MIDLVSLLVSAGNGGDGKISFLREKYMPKGGPDGGYGGDGGSVVVTGTSRFNTLKHYAGKKEISAEPGERGGRRKSSGSKGTDTVMTVPLGTVIWLEEENNQSALRREKYGIEHIFSRGEVNFEQYSVQKDAVGRQIRAEDDLHSLPKRVKLAEILEENQQIVICQGGFGGRGNIAFKSSTNITPMEAEHGTFGERKKIVLELKLLADVGLVGYPNAGKSTLLSKITRAHPKTASYPFTTIEPNLGVLNLPEGEDLVVADIPGLIEGAHSGKGLGHDFLRHIENCRELVFVLFLEESVVSDENLDDQAKAELVWQQYSSLRHELETYQAEMLKKPSLISLNKIDLYSPELITAIEKQFKKNKQKIYSFSGFTGKGLEELTQAISASA